MPCPVRHSWQGRPLEEGSCVLGSTPTMHTARCRAAERKTPGRPLRWPPPRACLRFTSRASCSPHASCRARCFAPATECLALMPLELGDVREVPTTRRHEQVVSFCASGRTLVLCESPTAAHAASGCPDSSGIRYCTCRPRLVHVLRQSSMVSPPKSLRDGVHLGDSPGDRGGHHLACTC